MHALARRPLGSSDIEVSVMSLGSLRTFERMSRDQGVAAMQAARDARTDDQLAIVRSLEVAP